jgi:hypothetical protein
MAASLVSVCPVMKPPALEVKAKAVDWPALRPAVETPASRRSPELGR